MKLSTEDLNQIEESLKLRLSEKRFLHTLGVRDSAMKLAGFCAPEHKCEIAVAALLHDITKELSEKENIDLIRKFNLRVDAEFFKSPQVLHSVTGAVVAKNDYSGFVTERVLSAILNHTVGSPDMTVFDEIIFLSDFIEESRKYEASLNVRKYVYENMSTQDKTKNIITLHTACVMAIDSTVSNLILNKRHILQKSILTRNVLLDKINNMF